MRLEPGTRLGPHEILGVVGAGGMGEVYRARDSRLGREVAIKVLPRDVTGDADRMARFEREARSASALNHRNIVTVHDFSKENGETWLVMELIRGESLREIIRRGPVPLRKLLPIASGVAEGLAVAHAAGIVHRDLKPENVMVTEDGTPKILDFGLVKTTGPVDPDSPTEARADVSRDGMVIGTANYMSPEQARGERVDFRTDHFSFGLMLHEMATGSHPFRRGSAVETLNGILNDEPATLSDSFPEPFVWIVERCLAKKPEERYGSTADLARDLANLRARPVTTPRRLESSPGRKWILPAILAVVAAGAIALALLWPREPQQPAAPVRVSVVTPELTSIDLGEVGMPLDISPDGRFIVISGSGPDVVRGLWLHDLRSGTTRLLTADGRLPGWSGDSKSIAFFADGKLKTMSVEGGPPRTICAARPEGIPSWRGDTILFTQFSVSPGIYRASARGGAPQVVVAAERTNTRFIAPWWPHFLPDGKRFLYMTLESDPGGGITHRLLIQSLDGGSPTFVTSIDSRAAYASGHLLFVRDGTLLAQPFDPESGRLSGEPAPIAGDIDYFKNTGLATFGVSDNGTLVWRAARRKAMLSWIDRKGDVLSTIGLASFAPGGRLSPDGRRYAVSIIDTKDGASDIWVYDLARENPERVTFGSWDEKSPVWAADGASLFHRSDGFRNPPDVVRRQLGADRSTMVYRGPGVDEPQDVSADGKWLLFIDYFTTGADVNVMALDPPGDARPFVATPFNETSARFSPDGKWVSYMSDVSGAPEIYIRPFENATESIRISKDGGTHPRWRRDGKELLFLGARGRVMSVPFANGVAGAPQLLFQAVDAVDFEPAADGSRFLVQLEQRTNAASINLLLNWPGQITAASPAR